ncbi:MAG: TIGR01777 family oxidoreductase [Phycisphaerales bacterium]
MNEITFESSLPATPAEVFAYHAAPGAFGRLLPPWDRVYPAAPHPGLVNGTTVEVDVKRGPFTLRARFEHSDVDPGSGFVDRQVKGPFGSWEHRHEFIPGPTGSTLRDRIRYSPPLSFVGEALAGPMMRRELVRLFAFRHARTRADLERIAWWKAAGAGIATVAVSGASGTIGAPLLDVLTTAGVRVRRMVRAPRTAGPAEVMWRSPEGGDPGAIDTAALEGVDAVVHLAGEPIATDRWTPNKKDRIRGSRVDGTKLIARALAGMARPPKVLVVASGISYYGERGEQEVTEEVGVGSGFRAEVARDWEAATEPARQAGIRVVQLRFGAVLSSRGGVLAMINPLFSLGLGGVPGAGSQWVSWVALDDTLGAILHTLADTTLSGPVNVTSPLPVRMDEFASRLAAAHGRSPFARIPVFAVRAVFSDRADVLLESCRVLPMKLRKAGFQFRQTDLTTALRWELGRIEINAITIR